MGDQGITSAEVEGFTVTTNTGESPQEIKEQLQDEKSQEEKPDLSDAASKLGKKGVEAKKAKAEKDSVKIETQEDGKSTEAAKPEEESEKKAEAPEKEEDAEEKPEEKPKRDRSARGRVLEATRKEAAAKRERDAALARVSDLEARLEALERPQQQERAPAQQDKGNGGDPEPQEEDFDNYRDFVRATARWEIRQEMAAAEKQRSVQSQAEAADRELMGHIDKFRASVADHVEEYSDDVLLLKTEFQLQQGEQPSGENWVANELVFSPESAPTLMRYFTEHPDELQRLAALSTPRAVSREMAKLETRLDVAKTGKPDSRTVQEVSRAHPPVTPVAGASGIGESDPAPRDGESFDSWYRRTKKTARR